MTKTLARITIMFEKIDDLSVGSFQSISVPVRRKLVRISSIVKLSTRRLWGEFRGDAILFGDGVLLLMFVANAEHPRRAVALC